MLSRMTAALAVFMFSTGCGVFDKKEAEADKAEGISEPEDLGVRNACVKAPAPSSLHGESSVFHFRHDGIPVCSHHGRSFTDTATGRTIMLGQDLTRRNLFVTRDASWPRRSQVEAFVRDELGMDGDARLTASLRCWYLAADDLLMPAWDMVFHTSGPVARVTASADAIFETGSSGFHAKGTVVVQKEGLDAGSEEISVDNLDDSGFLSGPNFKTVIADETEQAESAKFEFVFEPTDRRFEEASAFGNAELMLQWYQAHDPQAVDTGCFPVDINLHEVFPAAQGGRNNAVYEPVDVTGTGRPRIRLTDGDGEVLRNLSRDPDVLGHEFAHHVIYRGLRDMKDYESLVLHEGLADFLVFARTGNACLGETICPEGSGACVLVGQCLRSGDNQMSFLDEKLPTAFHRRSQVISGMLWELNGKPEFADNKLVKVLIAAIPKLLPRSTYRDLIVALMLADRDLNKGANACTIYEAAVARGLEPQISDISCKDI